MEFSKVVKERRSVRKYLDKEVSVSDIEGIIDEVRFSPSWKNTQPIKFFAIKDKELKNNIATNATAGFIYNEKTITRCNTLIVVCSSNDGMDKENLSAEEKAHWLSFDAGIATQSFCLSCYNKGISSVVLGIFNETKVKDLVGINPEYKVQALIAIGYSDVSNEAPQRLEVKDILTVK